MILTDGMWIPAYFKKETEKGLVEASVGHRTFQLAPNRVKAWRRGWLHVLQSKPESKGCESSGKLQEKRRNHRRKQMMTHKGTGVRKHISQYIKNRVLARQTFRCANSASVQLKGLEGYECPLVQARQGTFDESGYEIDHVQELSSGGSNDLENLQALCVACHRVKTARFLSERRR